MQKTSSYLKLHDVIELARAADFAWFVGAPLNRFITINLSLAGISLAHVQEFRTTFLARARDWLKYHDADFHFVWTMESQTALNLHLLCHVPPQLWRKGFKARLNDWLAEAGGIPKARAIHTDRAGDHLHAYPHALDSNYPIGCRSRLRYMCKGASPSVCHAFGIDHKPQGRITGKRSGFSESLGPAARARENWSWDVSERAIMPSAPNTHAFEKGFSV